MNIKQLETLVWTSRLGSVRKAAIQLGTSQPAASARIREIEEELGVAVFEREARPMRPSPQGREIIRLAEKMLDLSNAMLTYAHSSQPTYGEIRIGASHAVAGTWLPMLLRSLGQRMPGVEFPLVVDLNDRLREQLRRGDLDIAFAIGRVDDKAVGYSHMYDLPLEWVASKRCEGLPDIITPRRIERFPVLTDTIGSPVHQSVAGWFRAANVQPRRIDVCSGPQNRLNLAADGEWVTVLPASYLATAAHLADFRVIRSDPALDPMQVGASYRLASELVPTLQQIIAAAQEAARQWQALGPGMRFP